MTKVYTEMLEALRTSVLEIVAAEPADRDARLAKSFTEFEGALEKRLQDDLPLPIEGTDPVTLLGDRLSLVHDVIMAIEEGHVTGGDNVSEDSLMLAKGVVELGGLALHACAADFAEEVAEGEAVEEGMGLYKVATQGGEVLMKSALPESAAMFTADRIDTAEKVAEFSMELLDWLGVPVELAKKAPPPFARKGRGAPPQAENDEGQDDEGAEGAEGAEGEEGEEGEEGDEGAEGEEGDPEAMGDEGQDDGSPLENIARLTSLALLELDAIKQQLGPMGADQGDDPEGGLSALDALGQHLALAVVSADALNGAAAGADEGEPMDGAEMGEDQGEGQGDAQDGMQAADAGDMPYDPDEEAQKGTPTGELAKARQIATDLLAKNDDAKARLAAAEARAQEAESKLAALAKADGAKPAAAKAVTGAGAAVLTKSQDSGGDNNETQEERISRLAKMSPEAAAFELMKEAHRHPMRG